jgi:redox-sensitive bicupin YhaK (pirin superfamily)
MIEVIPFERLGRFDNDWLHARYHFSFAGYHDPARDGVGALLVWNDDTVEPRRGFDFHPHRDMEIVTYVRSGRLSHRDSLGHAERIEAGTIQVMSAGTGIVHSEYNDEAEPITLFQIWIKPNQRGGSPAYFTVPLDKLANGSGFVPLATGRRGVQAPAPIRQDASVLRAVMATGGRAHHALEPGRHAYLVATRGAFTLNGVAAKARDGLHVTGVPAFDVAATEPTELILVDVP